MGFEAAPSPRVAVIGGGPAGLMAAEVVAGAGLEVAVYDSKPSVGRKFLVAGKGGLNLTHSEALDDFLDRFGERREVLEKYLTAFGPDQMRAWARGLGFETFVGSSGRVFPEGMQAAPLLRAWVMRLQSGGVRFHNRHYWLGWANEHGLWFSVPDGERIVEVDAAVLALGGASWPQLGSDAAWVPYLMEKGVQVARLKPANVGFNVRWSGHFRDRYAGEPVKTVVLEFDSDQGETFRQQGEFIVTENGVEGSLIYAASRWIREQISRQGHATIYLDLAPHRSQQLLEERLSRPRGSNTLAKHLQRQAGIRGVRAGLLREAAADSDLQSPPALAALIKRLPVRLDSARPIEEAISTAGGVPFEEMDDFLMLNKIPGVFCAGEMLDWEAPTGGYLLTASFATGRAAGEGVLRWLHSGRH